MGKTLYLECASGISGDMVAGALIDLGASTERLGKALASLPVDGFSTHVRNKVVRGVTCCDFDVELDEAHENHDHDMAWLYGGLDGEGHAHEHHHEHDHEHVHDHEHAHEGHDHEHHHHHHEHRTLADVAAVVEASSLTPRAKGTAKRVFRILAEAEATAHGATPETVHFHEVGAVDSIVDVVTVAFCLDDLDVTECAVSPLAEGTGEIRCAHGVLPVPVPAVANIAAAHGLVLSRTGRKGELVTPTGAAIAAAVRTLDELPAAYRVTGVGMGSGKRAYDPPSLVRAMLVEPVEARAPELAQSAPAPVGASGWETGLVKLETEVDDCTGEALGYVMERLMAAGALEAHCLPCYMKKGRPAWQLEVLCREETRERLERIVFEDTTTIGIRRTPWDRTALPREAVALTCDFGEVRAKRVTLPSGARRVYPEYESVAELARSQGVGFQRVWQSALAAATN